MRKAPSSDASYFAPHAWRRVTLACDAMRAGTSHYPYTSSSHDLLSGCKDSFFFDIFQMFSKKSASFLHTPPLAKSRLPRAEFLYEVKVQQLAISRWPVMSYLTGWARYQRDYIRRVPVLYANITNVTKKTEYLGNEELQDVHVVDGFVGLCGLGLFWGRHLLDF